MAGSLRGVPKELSVMEMEYLSALARSRLHMTSAVSPPIFSQKA